MKDYLMIQKVGIQIISELMIALNISKVNELVPKEK